MADFVVGLLTTLIGAFFGVLLAFAFDECLKKRKWIKRYRAVWRKKLAKTSGGFETTLNNLRAHTVSYDEKIKQARRQIDDGSVPTDRFDKIDTPFIDLTIDYNSVFTPLTTEFLTRMPIDLIEAIIDYEHQYRTVEIKLRHYHKHCYSPVDVKEDLEQWIVWHEENLKQIRIVQNQIERLAEYGDRATECLDRIGK